MKNALALAAAAVVCSTASLASAAQLHNETFSADGTLANYTGTGKIFSNSGGLDSAPVAGGKLAFQLIANQAGTTGATTTDFGGVQGLISLELLINPISYVDASFRIVVGNDDPGWVQWDPLGRSFATLMVRADGITIGANPAVPFTLNQPHSLTMFLNDTDLAEPFTGPDGASRTLNAGSFSVFDGTTLVAGNVTKGSDEDLGSFGMIISRNYLGAQHITEIDQLTVRNDLQIAVPEPTSLALLGLSGLALTRRQRRE